MKKRIIILSIFCAVTFFSLDNYTIYAKQPATLSSTVTSAIPYSINYEWRYKLIGSKLYRRLYDCTNQRWASDWELCP